MNKKHALILGASGFVGKKLFQLLTEMKEEYRITILVHKKEPSFIPGEVRVLRGNLNDFDLSALGEDKPDVIFHLARINSPRFGKLGRYRAAIKGYRANARLLKYLENSGWEGSLIYLSGSLMYGDSNGQYFDENTPLNPTSFAREYYWAERPFLRMFSHPKISVTMVRAPWILGNGSWFKAFYLDVLKKKNIIYGYSPDDFKMMLLDLDDCASALIRIASLKHQGVLNVFMPGIISYKDFISTLSEVSGVSTVYSFSEQELKKKYERAIYEAFTREILLSTKYPQYQLQEQFKYKDAKTLLRERLASFLKDE